MARFGRRFPVPRPPASRAAVTWGAAGTAASASSAAAGLTWAAALSGTAAAASSASGALPVTGIAAAAVSSSAAGGSLAWQAVTFSSNFKGFLRVIALVLAPSLAQTRFRKKWHRQ